MYSIPAFAFRRGVRRTVLLALGVLTLAAHPPRSTLHIVAGDASILWWRSDRAPDRWTAPLPAVADRFAWGDAAPGVDTASAELHVNRGLLRLRIIAVRLDPARLDLRLVPGTAPDGFRGTWTVDSADPGAVFAVNAGQFSETGPWGWLVADGRELRYPGAGPLALALAVDTLGDVRWLSDDAVMRTRARAPIAAAFQSYPMLLDSAGRVPGLLSSRAIDGTHRDTRLAAGRLPDGRILFILTRFAGGGRILERFPTGLTTPETAALMGALGTRPAVMLDGGLSAQMLVRTRTGAVRAWPGARRVPLALVAFPPH